MTDYEHQLRAIRRTLDRHDAHLCRMGKSEEWIALGLPDTPTLHYRSGCWITSDETLETLIHQAIGENHEHSHSRQPSRPSRRRSA
jgi:hypothetical protein